MSAPAIHRSTPSRTSFASSDTNSIFSLSSSSNIKVIARFRPPNEVESSYSEGSIVEFLSEDSCQITTKDFSGSFTFDQVFDTESQQKQVFEYSLRPTVEDLMKGYNGTVLAYGQTGSGKSYTMMGSSIDDPVYRGAIPRIVDMIFDMILHSSSDIEYTVKVSYMEIYMERIKDLLNPQNDNLPIHEDKTRGVYVKGLTEEYVSSTEEVYEVMRKGSGVRAVASTNMNEESSRSHSIFAIVVSQKNTVSGAQKSGQLFLVDLAGSEKVGKTGASGQTLEEAKKINKSLSALGMVINSLTDGKSTHIPYRDSKLTRILQESLGGNSRTSLIVNCSPSSYNDAETLSTLRFGVRAKNIRNKAKINTELSPEELRQLLKKSQRLLETRISYSNKLEGELTGWRNGEPPSSESWVTLGVPTPDSRSQTANSFTFPSSPSTPRPASALSMSRTSTPSIFRNGSRHIKRSSMHETMLRPMSPQISEVDPVDEFLRRENDLQDQLSEKESTINRQDELILELKTQLNAQKSELSKATTEYNLKVDNLTYEKKELEIKFDSLKDENGTLITELREAKLKLLDNNGLAISEDDNRAAESPNVETQEKMSGVFESLAQSTKSLSLRDNSQTRETLKEAVSILGEVTSRDPEFEKQIAEVSSKVNSALADLENDSDHPSLEQILEEQDSRFQNHLKNITTQDKSQTELAYEAQLRVSSETAQQLLEEVERLQLENKRLQSKHRETVASLFSVQSSTESVTSTESDFELQVPSSETVGTVAATMKEKEKEAAAANEKIKSMQSQISQFEAMKTALMKDLQDRCERVIELEISLDQAREQYNFATRDGNSKQQQKKMAMLQRNLEQLTAVQRQLMEQNMVLKKDIDMANKISDARNDRIQALEMSLRESQTRLDQESEIFETKLTYLRDRLLDVKRTGGSGLSSLGGTGSPVPHTSGRRELMLSPFPSTNSHTSGGGSSKGSSLFSNDSFYINTKIVKPLRGGGQQQPPKSPVKKEGLWTKLNSIVSMTP